MTAHSIIEKRLSRSDFGLCSLLLLAISLLPLATHPAAAEDKPPIRTEMATFAGGCFWCLEAEFSGLPGVIRTTVGYAAPLPAEREGREVLQLTFDPQKISYAALVDRYWRNIDPTQADGQFADRGERYRTAIFYHSAEQQRTAEASKQKLIESAKFTKPIVTEILAAQDFRAAEDLHQKYYLKFPERYKQYKRLSGREDFVKDVWR